MRVAVVGGGNGGEPASRQRPRWCGAEGAARALPVVSPSLCLAKLPPMRLLPLNVSAGMTVAAMAGQWASRVDLYFSRKYADRAAALVDAIQRNGGLIVHTK